MFMVFDEFSAHTTMCAGMCGTEVPAEALPFPRTSGDPEPPSRTTAQVTAAAMNTRKARMPAKK
jgi:hypothetical protein